MTKYLLGSALALVLISGLAAPHVSAQQADAGLWVPVVDGSANLGSTSLDSTSLPGSEPASLDDIREFALSTCAADVLMCLPAIEQSFEYLKQTRAELVAAETSLNDALSASETLNGELTRVSTEYSELSDKYRGLLERESAVEAQLIGLVAANARAEKLEMALYASDEVLTESNVRLANLESALEQALNERDALSIDLANANDHALLLEDELANLELTLSERATSTVVADSLLDDRNETLAALEAALGDKEQTIAALKAEVGTLTARNNDAVDKFSAAELRQNQMAAELAVLTAELQSTRSEATEIASLRDDALRERSRIAGQLSQVNEQLLAAERALRKTETQKDMATKELADTQTRYSALVSHNDDLKTALESIRATLPVMMKSLNSAEERAAAEAAKATQLKVELAAAQQTRDLGTQDQRLMADAARSLLTELVGGGDYIDPTLLRDVQDFGESTQNYIYNNVVTGWLRNQNFGDFEPVTDDSQRPFATEGILELQREMNAWLIDNGTDTVSLGLPFQSNICARRLCLDGIVGQRTKLLAEIIYRRDPGFFPGAGAIR